jgi:hypothetical protein
MKTTKRTTKPHKAKRRASAATGSVVPADYRKQHRPDEFAVRLRKHIVADDGNIDPAKLKELAEANGAWQFAYADLNVGMRFMNVSNRLRALVRRGAKIKWAAVLLALVLVAGDRATAQPQTRTFYNDRGQITGTATTRGNVTVFSNQKGQQTGRAERRGDATTNFYNNRGQMIGTSRHDGRPR